VLAPRQSTVTAGIAPNVGDLGVMLPYTPLHALLLTAVNRALVMTSGNTTDEPIAFVDDDAHTRLGAIADRVVTCDRVIHLRCEDSIARVADGAPMILRRARGYAPAPLVLPVPLDRPTLALGGHFKSAFALGAGDIAFVSPHLGDLDHQSAYDAFESALEHFQRLHRVTPERVVHDQHPDYATTWLAEQLGVPRSAIQHHHAHFASAHADALLDGPAIGVIFDGHGYSTDGTIWGGELLVGDCASTRRAAHLRAIPQPGGDRAAREPWRMAVAYLREAGEPIDEIVDRRGPIANRVAALCAGSPLTSSTGRLFDAVAGILGICDVSSYEGEAAMRLEALARTAQTAVTYPIHIVPADQDTASLFARGSRRSVDAGEPIARGSHQNLPFADTLDVHDVHDVHDLHWLADIVGGAREPRSILRSTACGSRSMRPASRGSSTSTYLSIRRRTARVSMSRPRAARARTPTTTPTTPTRRRPKHST
jgi:hydrogenase maturation protein HypF